MRKLKKNFLFGLLTLLASIFLIACGSSNDEVAGQDKLEQIENKGELNIGTSPDFPPMEFYILDENGDRQIVGSDIALAQAIADEIGVDLKITATDFDGVMANIQGGSVDMGIAGFTFTEMRSQVMQFSEGYTQESSEGYQGLLVTEETAKKFDSLEEVENANLTLGAQGGSIQFELAQTLTDDSKIKQYATLDIGLLALNEGDIDAMVVSTSSAAPMLDTFPDLEILPQEEFDLDPDEKYNQVMIGFPKGEEYESLIEVADQVIQEAKDTGKIDEWREEAKELSNKAVE